MTPIRVAAQTGLTIGLLLGAIAWMGSLNATFGAIVGVVSALLGGGAFGIASWRGRRITPRDDAPGDSAPGRE